MLLIIKHTITCPLCWRHNYIYIYNHKSFPSSQNITFRISHIYGQLSQIRRSLSRAPGQLPVQADSPFFRRPSSAAAVSNRQPRLHCASAHVPCPITWCVTHARCHACHIYTSNITLKVQTIIPSGILPQTLKCYTTPPPQHKRALNKEQFEGKPPNYLTGKRRHRVSHARDYLNNQ